MAGSVGKLTVTPWLSEFAAALRLPAAVRGPVLLRALRRLAAIAFADVMPPASRLLAQD
jgi:hypothetical protein